MQQNGTLGKMWPVRTLRVNDLLKKQKGYVWFQEDISLADHMLVGRFQFGITGSMKQKHPNTIEDKQCRTWGKYGWNKVTNTYSAKEVVPLGR